MGRVHTWDELPTSARTLIGDSYVWERLYQITGPQTLLYTWSPWGPCFPGEACSHQPSDHTAKGKALGNSYRSLIQSAIFFFQSGMLNHINSSCEIWGFSVTLVFKFPFCVNHFGVNILCNVDLLPKVVLLVCFRWEHLWKSGKGVFS